MEKIMYSDIKIKDTTVSAKLFDMKTDELKDEAFITIEEHEVMVEFINILHIPLNQITHGEYKDGCSLNCLLNDVLEQATKQVQMSI